MKVQAGRSPGSSHVGVVRGSFLDKPGVAVEKRGWALVSFLQFRVTVVAEGFLEEALEPVSRRLLEHIHELLRSG